MLQAIIFDCDGVICESVDLKTEAFRKIFKQYPKNIHTITEYHLNNGGLSRYKKFDYIYKNILKKDLSDNERRVLGENFSQAVVQEVINCPYVQGAFEFIERYHRKYLFFIVSGTPQEEMVKIVQAKNLSGYFKGVYGSPAAKLDTIRAIMKKYSLKQKDILLVGDSINDFEAAKAAGISFAARVTAHGEDFFKDKKEIAVIKDLTQLEQFLN